MADDQDKEKTEPLEKVAFGKAAEDFGKEIVPLGKEAGEVTVRAVRAGLVVVEGLVWGFEQIIEYVQRAVAEKLKDVPPEKIGDANPRIAVPAIEALRYSGDEPDIREMFATLIASDLNTDTKRHAHPSFVELIKQMSPLDGKVLKAVVIDRGAILYQERLYLDKGNRQHFNALNRMVTIGVSGITLEEIEKAIYNLDRLGLLRISETTWPAGKIIEKVKTFTESEEHKMFLQQFKDAIPEFRSTGHHVGIFVTPLGDDFAQACL